MQYRHIDAYMINYMSDMLSYIHDFNNYPTRNSTENMLYVPKHRVDISKQAHQYSAQVCYNDLPHDIIMSQSLDTFKCYLENHIISIN